jgi:acyl carrier protein
MTLDERMKEVFADAFEVAPDQISEDMSIENSGTWDSMRSITLVFSLEQAFEIEFSERELLAIDSYAAVRGLLQSKGMT